MCCVVVSGDLGGRQAGVHSERREGQPWLEALDRGRQTLPGGLTASVIRFGHGLMDKREVCWISGIYCTAECDL